MGIYTAILRGVILEAVTSRYDVDSISADSLAFIAAEPAGNIAQKGAPWHLVSVSQNGPMNPRSVMNYNYNATAGAGVDIFLLVS